MAVAAQKTKVLELKNIQTEENGADRQAEVFMALLMPGLKTLPGV